MGRKWDSIDWDAILKLYLVSNGPVISGFRKLTGHDLVCCHAVQAGRPDPSEWINKVSIFWTKGLTLKLVASGCKLPPVRQLMFVLQAYENSQAIAFHELSASDIQCFNSDLALCLEKLPTADTIHYPYGDKFTGGCHRPYVTVSCTDYDAAIKSLDEGLVPNTEPMLLNGKEVAYDITAQVLA